MGFTTENGPSCPKYRLTQTNLFKVIHTDKIIFNIFMNANLVEINSRSDSPNTTTDSTASSTKSETSIRLGKGLLAHKLLDHHYVT